VHTLTLTERKKTLHSCKWVQFPSQTIDLGVFFNSGDWRNERLMKRFKDWLEIFIPGIFCDVWK
jgi:SRSO17 transposase